MASGRDVTRHFDLIANRLFLLILLLKCANCKLDKKFLFGSFWKFGKMAILHRDAVFLEICRFASFNIGCTLTRGDDTLWEVKTFLEDDFSALSSYFHFCEELVLLFLWIVYVSILGITLSSSPGCCHRLWRWEKQPGWQRRQQGKKHFKRVLPG